MTTKTISHFQADHILTRFVFPPLQRTEKGESSTIASEKIEGNTPISLRVTAEGDKYTFSYSVKDNNYQTVGGTVSGDILSTNVAGGFTGAMIGLYATTSNDAEAL